VILTISQDSLLTSNSVLHIAQILRTEGDNAGAAGTAEAAEAAGGAGAFKSHRQTGHFLLQLDKIKEL
jgi:hypothetical protein